MAAEPSRDNALNYASDHTVVPPRNLDDLVPPDQWTPLVRAKLTVIRWAAIVMGIGWVVVAGAMVVRMLRAD